MKLQKKSLILISLVFFMSSLVFLKGCKNPEDATVETSSENPGTDNTDETSSRCEFATSNVSETSLSADNQSQKAFRLLLQATFGPQKKDLERILEIGETAWIEEQLNYDSAPKHLMQQRINIPLEFKRKLQHYLSTPFVFLLAVQCLNKYLLIRRNVMKIRCHVVMKNIPFDCHTAQYVGWCSVMIP